MSEQSRYYLYMTLLAGLLGGYFLIDSAEHRVGLEPPANARGTAELPAINLLEPARQGTVKRNLFAFVEPKTSPIQPVAPVAPTPPPPPPVDRLATVQVLGFVERRNGRAILIKVGEELITISGKERFGQDDALAIDEVLSGQVRVIDNFANVSKTYILSKE